MGSAPLAACCGVLRPRACAASVGCAPPQQHCRCGLQQPHCEHATEAASRRHQPCPALCARILDPPGLLLVMMLTPEPASQLLQSTHLHAAIMRYTVRIIILRQPAVLRTSCLSCFGGRTQKLQLFKVSEEDVASYVCSTLGSPAQPLDTIACQEPAAAHC